MSFLRNLIIFALFAIFTSACSPKTVVMGDAVVQPCSTPLSGTLSLSNANGTISPGATIAWVVTASGCAGNYTLAVTGQPTAPFTTSTFFTTSAPNMAGNGTQTALLSAVDSQGNVLQTKTLSANYTVAAAVQGVTPLVCTGVTPTSATSVTVQVDAQNNFIGGNPSFSFTVTTNISSVISSITAQAGTVDYSQTPANQLTAGTSHALKASVNAAGTNQLAILLADASNSGNTGSCFLSVSVTTTMVQAPTGTVNLTANSSAGPISVPFGSVVALAWTSLGVTACNLTPSTGLAQVMVSGSMITATTNLGVSGSATTLPMLASGTYSMSCPVTGGSPATGSVTINVPALATQPLVMNLDAANWDGKGDPGANPSTKWTDLYSYWANYANPGSGISTFIGSLGGNAADWEGNGRNGNPYMFNLDGNTHYFDMGNTSQMNISGQITLEAWVNPNISNKSYPVNIIMHGAVCMWNSTGSSCSGGSGNVAYLNMMNGKYVVGAGNGTCSAGSYNSCGDTWQNFSNVVGDQYHIGNNSSASMTPPSSDYGSWVHLVGTYDGSSWNIYRNGKLGTSNSGNGPQAVTETSGVGHWAIGSNAGGGRAYFQGPVSIARIYSGALSASDVYAHCQASATLFGVSCSQ